MPCELLTERRERTMVLTLCDPATRNALSPQANIAGVEALDSAESNSDVRCVVLRGDGKHFCSGGDLQRLQRTRALGHEAGSAAQRQAIDAFHGFIEALAAFPKPTIAAVEGFAAGGGCSLALACDLIVAADDARFVMSYGRVGLTPDGGGSWQLARRLPRALALQWLWLPEPVDAREAQRLGLVNWVCAPGQSLTDALRVADRLAAMAPNALTAAKVLFDQAARGALREQLAAEREQFVTSLMHGNGGEGLQAFVEKRAPRFDD